MFLRSSARYCHQRGSRARHRHAAVVRLRRAAMACSHTVWQAARRGLGALVQRRFAALDALYIADGHHRAASAARARRRSSAGATQLSGGGVSATTRCESCRTTAWSLDFGGTRRRVVRWQLLRERSSARLRARRRRNDAGAVSVFVKDRWYTSSCGDRRGCRCGRAS